MIRDVIVDYEVLLGWQLSYCGFCQYQLMTKSLSCQPNISGQLRIVPTLRRSIVYMPLFHRSKNTMSLVIQEIENF